MILVLGGSNFMGKALLQQLSQNKEYEVHYINRGKSYWNNEVKQIPNIHYTYGNRSEKKDFTKLLVYLSRKLDITEESGKKWDCVVDFCAYERSHVKSVVLGLENLCKCYVLISTDSVYEVCDLKIRTLPTIVEEYSVRPEDPEVSKQAKSGDSYGHNKLRCEEYLYRIKKEGSKFNFISLRLPDVIGPYDDTCRFWTMMFWIARANTYPVEIDEDCKTKLLSFVYSEDVVKCIMYIVAQVHTDESKIAEAYNKSYNLACFESCSYLGLLDMMATAMETKFIIQEPKKAKTYLPSVSCGPLNISKALSQLKWEPTKLAEVVKETCKFFMSVQGKYLNEEKKAIAALPGLLKF